MKNQSLEIVSFGEVELSYKRKQTSTFKSIKSSSDAITVIRKVFPNKQICYREHMYVLYLDNSNNVLGYQLLSVGGITSTMIDIRILIQGALLSNAVAIILFHNHPSGKLKPSTSDKALTQKVIQSAEILDLKILDHLIITENSYYSFADNGLI